MRWAKLQCKPQYDTLRPWEKHTDENEIASFHYAAKKSLSMSTRNAIQQHVCSAKKKEPKIITKYIK